DIQYLTSRGYSVLQVNFRGSSGFGKDFTNSGRGQFGRAIEQDIGFAVAHVKKQYPYKQMCSIGISYGGYSAMMLAMKNPAEYQCVIAMYGVYDLPHLFNASRANKKIKERNLKGLEKVIGKNNESLKAVSPFYIANTLQTPLLMIAGKNDWVAWFEQSNRMKHRLEQLNKEMETIFYNGVSHGHHNWFGDRHQYAYIDEFIRKKLKLPPLDGNKHQEAVTQDLLNIANMHNITPWIEADDEIALNYYQKAAKLGSAKGIYNVAHFFEKGRKVKKDIDKAMKMYHQASKLGNKAASYRLGQIYSLGLTGQVNHEKSLELFQLAEKQGNNLAYFEIAKASCNGHGTAKDIDDCINKLSRKKPQSSPLENRRQAVIAELMAQPDFKGDGRQRIKDLLSKQFGIRQFDTSGRLDHWGLYDRFTHIRTSNQVPMVAGIQFGAQLRLDASQSYEDEEQTVFNVKWSLPEVINGKVVGRITEHKLLFNYLNKKLKVTYPLKKSQLVEAEWSVELTTLDNELLYEKTFQTKKGLK
ncbi:MAG: prolyl oligopeptidase family serine peptidase, partial [Psychrosphaera sp.]|nr:prolyl oligopeptidase family serine peptidase [Psychrosphaera sp.]